MNRRPQPSDFGLSPLADNVDSITQRPRVRVSRIRHGIGGGMRFSDEIEIARATPSRFSGEFMGRRLSLTGGRVILGIYMAVLIAALLIVHVNLRFQIHDMQMQQHALQNVDRHLERECAMLEGRKSYLADPYSLKEYAMLDLGMVENKGGMEVSVAPYLIEKYSPESVAATHTEQENELARLRNGRTKNPFRRFAETALAFAQR